MKIIASIAEKGGVGKTAIACIVAAGLRLAGARVLLVALDVQTAGAAIMVRHATATSVAASAAGALSPSAVASFAGPASAVPATATTARLLLGEDITPLPGHLGIDVLCGGPALDGGDIRALRSDELRFGLQRLADRYDAVVIDVAPVMLHLHRLALDAADLALVIGDAHSGESMASLAKLMAEIETARSRRATVPEVVIPVINKVNRLHALDVQVVDRITSCYGATHTIIEIPETAMIPKAIALRRPEVALRTTSPARLPLQELVMHAGQLIARSER